VVGLGTPLLTMPDSVVLASASPSRAQLLSAAGFRFTTKASDVDEDALVAGWGPLTPAEMALRLARAKAEAVAATQTDDQLVLGCDSVLDVDGEAFGKPLTAEIATQRWHMQRGRTCVLHTGHWLIRTGSGPGGTDNAVGRIVSTEVSFVDASDDEISAYVASGEPLNVAGAFTLEGRAGPLIAGINGDYSNVIGLSLPGLRGLLNSLGIALPEMLNTVEVDLRK
jgi:septum formation protein